MSHGSLVTLFYDHLKLEVVDVFDSISCISCKHPKIIEWHYFIMINVNSSYTAFINLNNNIYNMVLIMPQGFIEYSRYKWVSYFQACIPCELQGSPGFSYLLCKSQISITYLSEQGKWKNLDWLGILLLNFLLRTDRYIYKNISYHLCRQA